MDWLKKEWLKLAMAFMFTIITSSFFLSLNSVVAMVKQKADKEFVEEKFTAHEEKEQAIHQQLEIKIEANEKRHIQTRELFLYEVRELRKDLKLKQDK